MLITFDCLQEEVTRLEEVTSQYQGMDCLYYEQMIASTFRMMLTLRTRIIHECHDTPTSWSSR